MVESRAIILLDIEEAKNVEVPEDIYFKSVVSVGDVDLEVLQDREDFPDIMDDWDGKYGDRCNQVVFIGKGYEKKAIVERLYECIDE